jgi:hypothetical protein
MIYFAIDYALIVLLAAKNSWVSIMTPKLTTILSVLNSKRKRILIRESNMGLAS